ncbi:MAG: alkaline phytoceramidase [Bacteroidetes bacterium]|nr:alkaline phytoceramidase [Bacteroidota bacterium]
MILSKKGLVLVLISIAVSATLALFLFPPIEQNLSFHNFADQRSIIGIHNFANVVSNLAYFMAGIFGLLLLFQNKLQVIPQVKAAYYIFFFSLVFVAAGSAYYHWRPDNFTLVWDRLPMTFAFMSLLSFTLAECVTIAWGKISLIPLLLAGAFSIIYWYNGLLHGAGDLRWYALVQFLPTILLLVMLIFARSVYNSQWGYWCLLLAYVAAKITEKYDTGIFNTTAGITSGHTLKHLISAAGIFVFIAYLEKRRLNTIEADDAI